MRFFRLVAFFSSLGLLMVSGSSTPKCPDSCTCPEHPEDLFVIDCSGLSALVLPNNTLQVDCLQDFDPDKFPGKFPSAPEVSLTNCPPDTFSSHLTKSLFLRNLSKPTSRVRLGSWPSLQKLDVSHNELEFLSSRFLEGMNGVVQLDLSRCRLLFIYPFVFKDFSLLQELYLEDNKLTEIEDNQFEELSSLWLLHLWGNRLSRLENNSFSGLTELRQLDLSHNRLSTINPVILAPLKKLQHLDLSHNRFQSLPGNLLRHSSKLQVFKFEHNLKQSVRNPDAEWLQTIEIPQGFLSDLPDLRRASFAESAVAVVPRFLLRGSASLTHLNLKGNRLTTIPRFFLHDAVQLRWLDLSHNQLSNVTGDLLSGLSTSLLYLNVSNNRLSSLPPGAVYESVHVLDMRHNEYETLSNDVTQQLRKNVDLRELFFVQGNPWNCKDRNTEELFKIIVQILDKGVASDFESGC
ncbi:Hypothetical predicted protein [Cloeon dipterum]|uniref:LRRNT domain-containing protein n=1 Tax=Cloeon dipterum TaxID=197152 RepID=A0A8S1DUQ3_9INSE|nr:Hypothetical predicted protein [Cloeon dipterum]